MSMLPPDLQQQVQQMQNFTKSLQSKVDRQTADKRKWVENDNGTWVDNGAAKIKNAKGKDKGKGKGKGAANKFKKFRGPRGGKAAGQ